MTPGQINLPDFKKSSGVQPVSSGTFNAMPGNFELDVAVQSEATEALGTETSCPVNTVFGQLSAVGQGGALGTVLCSHH